MNEKAIICPQCKIKLGEKALHRCPRCNKILTEYATCKGCGKCSTGKIK